MTRPVKYDKHYAESAAACGDPFAPFVAFVAGLEEPSSVLDLGCGQGRDALLFARAGHRVLGLDISSVGTEQLAAVASAEGLELQARVGDLEEFQASELFDVVILDRVLHMLPDMGARARALEQACAATRPGGTMLLSEYAKQHPLIVERFDTDPGWRLSTGAKGFFRADRTAGAPAGAS